MMLNPSFRSYRTYQSELRVKADATHTQPFHTPSACYPSPHYKQELQVQDERQLPCQYRETRAIPPDDACILSRERIICVDAW